jgi:GAF domain-containing protein
VERAVPSTRLILLLRQEGTGELTPLASRQRSKSGGTQPLAISRTILMAVLAENTSVLTSDATEDPRFREQMSIVAQAVHSAMAVPLFDNEKVLGILYAESNFPGLSYNQEQLEILTLLANMAAVKITNARLLETEQHRLRMQQELSTAMGIQRGLLRRRWCWATVTGRLESRFGSAATYDWQATSAL